MPTRYYIPADDESPVVRLWNQRIRGRTPVPEFPRTIQIQTQSGCNARCTFCPNSSIGAQLDHGRMDDDLYHKIIDEAVQYDVRRFSPYLMNEPLTDRAIGERIRYITDRKPEKAVTKINSNGALLKEDTARALIDSGLDRVSFSVHGIRPEAYRESMGNLNIEDTLRNINRFLELKKEMKSSHPRVRVTMVKTTTLEPQLDEIHAYWDERNVRVNIRGLSNRGDKDISRKGLNVAKWTPYRSCTDLFDQMFISVEWRRGYVLRRLGADDHPRQRPRAVAPRNMERRPLSSPAREIPRRRREGHALRPLLSRTRRVDFGSIRAPSPSALSAAS